MRFNNLLARAVHIQVMNHTNLLLHKHRIRNSTPPLDITNAVDAKVGDIGPMTVQHHLHKDRIAVVWWSYDERKNDERRRGGRNVQRGRGRQMSVNASLTASGSGASVPQPPVQDTAPVPVPPRPGN